MNSPAALSSAAQRLPSTWRIGCIVIGGLFGWMAVISPGGLFLLGVVALTALLLHRLTHAEHRRFVVMVFLVGFAIRALLSLGLDAGARMAEGHWPSKHGPPHDWDLGITYRTRDYIRMGDSDYLFQRGYATALLARGVREPVVVYRAQQSYGRSGYAYVLGAFCYLFDFSPSATTLINCLLGALLAPAIFVLAAACYDSSVARWAAIAVAGFPSLLLWSASHLKEPSMHVLTAWLLWLFLRLQEPGSFRSRLGYGLLTVSALAMHMTLRSAAYTWLLVGCALAAWGLTWCARRSRFLTWLGLLLAVVLVAQRVDARVLLVALFHVHLGHFTAPGICYQYLPQAFYTPAYELEWLQTGRMSWDVVIWIGKAVGHYLLEPFPWHIDNLFTLLSYPQMVLWYFLLPLAGAGVVAAMRWRLHTTLGVLLTLAAWIVLGGLTNGNIGTVFRMRDMVTPLILLFACAGAQWCIYGRPPGHPPSQCVNSADGSRR